MESKVGSVKWEVENIWSEEYRAWNVEWKVWSVEFGACSP